MITPPTKSFFVLSLSGDAADLIMEKLSPTTAADVREAVVISKDYDTDIEAGCEMNKSLDLIQTTLGKSFTPHTTLNPLYFPATQADIDAVLDGDTSENYRFIGMDSNPYTIQIVKLMDENEEEVVDARVGCYQFELPTYSEIIEEQERVVVN